MSKPPAVFAPGFVIAPGYEIIAHVSRGGALDVYDVWSEERIAKTLRPDRWSDRAVRRRLEAEGRVLRRLSHPLIVRAYERPATTNPVLVMETLSGETLAHLIEEGEGLSPAEIAHLGLHLCSAVQYLHRNQILHLDLKPANIIAEAGRAKIMHRASSRPRASGRRNLGLHGAGTSVGRESSRRPPTCGASVSCSGRPLPGRPRSAATGTGCRPPARSYQRTATRRCSAQSIRSRGTATCLGSLRRRSTPRCP